MFRILLDRGLSPIVIRCLIDQYTRQRAQAIWEGETSQYFTVENGIRQGGILSPVLFTVYMDGLLSRLEESGYGCHIGDTFYGALCYADNITLICPSVHGLQQMVNICQTYGKEFDVKINETKTVCISFSRQRTMKNIHIYLIGR